MDLRVLLGHGASGSALTMRPWVDGLGRRGFEAIALDLPRGRAERAATVFLDAMRGPDPARVARHAVPGGHSFGGRAASLAVRGLIDEGHRPAGLLLLSYPLHRPGMPDTWVERTAHWPGLRCPVLLLSGESDPFARIDLLRHAVTLLPDSRLVTYPGVGHGLLPVLEAALEEAAGFLRDLSNAAAI